MTRLFVISLLLFVVTLSPINAASSKNLLKGLNPSFEQGITNWEWDHPSSTLPNFVIANGTAGNRCGTKFLRIKKSTSSPNLSSPHARIRVAGKYRFSFWLRAKHTPQQDASVDAINIVFRSGDSMSSTGVHIDKNYLIQWTKHIYEFDLDTPWEEAWIAISWKNYFGGKILIDCARIEKL